MANPSYVTKTSDLKEITSLLLFPDPTSFHVGRCTQQKLAALFTGHSDTGMASQMPFVLLSTRKQATIQLTLDLLSVDV